MIYWKFKIGCKTGGVGPSNPPSTGEAQDSNVDGTAIEISSSPMFGLDDIDLENGRQPPHSDEFLMVFDEEESSGSQHSTLNPKEKKKKKLAVTRKELLKLQSKVDQILAAITTNPL